MNRRPFVQALAWTACGSCLGLGALSLRPLERALVPVLLGDLSLLPRTGLRLFPAHQVAVVRTDGGFGVLSTRCTHLGCALRLRGHELVCPCHGGLFSQDGAVIAGPPPAPLPWFEGGVTPDRKLFFYPSRPLAERRLVQV